MKRVQSQRAPLLGFACSLCVACYLLLGGHGRKSPAKIGKRRGIEAKGGGDREPRTKFDSTEFGQREVRRRSPPSSSRTSAHRRWEGASNDFVTAHPTGRVGAGRPRPKLKSTPGARGEEEVLSDAQGQLYSYRLGRPKAHRSSICIARVNISTAPSSKLGEAAVSLRRGALFRAPSLVFQESRVSHTPGPIPAKRRREVRSPPDNL